MRHECTLPDLGEGLTEAEIVDWLVTVGDPVEEDQPIVQVETAKALVDIPSSVTGTVVELGGRPGDVLSVGALLIAFDTQTGQERLVREDPAHPNGAPPTLVSNDSDSPGRPGRDSAPATTSAVAKATSARVLASPSTRRHAVSVGVDLSRIPGSGPAGRVTREDVDHAAAHNPATTAVPSAPQPSEGQSADEEVPLRGIRRQIARTMTRSWQQIPHITEFRELNATRLVEARTALLNDASTDARLTFLPFLVLACATVLAHHRAINASVDIDREVVTYRGAVNIGIATSNSEGLVVPVLHNADRLGLWEISDRVTELAETARTRRLRSGELDGGTFTISNFGSYGTWLGTPIINPPQAAIAGFGRIRDTVVAVDGQPVVRPTLPIAVSADHRIIDGDVLGAFVNDLAALIENPILLIGGAR